MAVTNFNKTRVYFFRFKYPVGCGKVGSPHKNLVVTADRPMYSKQIFKLCQDVVVKLKGQSLFLKYVYPRAPFNIPVIRKMEGAQIEHRAEMTSDFPLTAYKPTAHEDKRRQAFQDVLEDLISKHFKKLSVINEGNSFFRI